MNAVFFIMLTLFLIVLQTVILPSFSWFTQCFDLLVINVLFLSLVSSHYTTVFAILAIGCIMDSISGAPFGYYSFSYIWIYIVVSLIKQLVFKQSIFFVLIASFVSILIQHGLLLFSVFIQQDADTVMTFDYILLVKQVIWGGIFIPLAIWFVNVCWQNWMFISKILKKQMLKNSEGRFDRL